MKVLPFLEDATERIARIGFYERIAKKPEPYYAGSDVDLSDRNIIFTTIDALVLQDIAGARVYDYVIVDRPTARVCWIRCWRWRVAADGHGRRSDAAAAGDVRGRAADGRGRQRHWPTRPPWPTRRWSGLPSQARST